LPPPPSTMSTYSLPSSPESVSDEDNHPKARPWYESEWTPEELGIVPVEPTKRKRERWASTAWVHHPDPALVDRAANRAANRTEAEKNRRRKKEKRQEKREEMMEERREERAMWRRIRRSREKEDDAKREANARARDDRERANRAADWK